MAFAPPSAEEWLQHDYPLIADLLLRNDADLDSIDSPAAAVRAPKDGTLRF
jgi:hypothetical protein